VIQLTDEDVKEAIQMAIQMERDGYDFYRKAAAQTSSKTGQELFESLAGDELVHLDTFQKIFSEKVGKDEWEVLVNSSKKYETPTVFPRDLKATGADPDTNDLDALHMAMDAEQQAVEHYTKILNGTGDAEVRRIITEIINQEKSHYSILNEEFTHLNNTGFWYELDYMGD
jgi:rubrerythrin